jgi:hypothetical protein
VKTVTGVALVSALFLGSPAEAYRGEGCARPSEVTGHRFAPDCKGIFHAPDGASWPFSTNDMGLVAEPNYSPHPEEGTLRVLVVAGSIFMNFSEKVGIVPMMEKTVKEIAPRLGGGFKKVELINGSEMGFNIVQMYLRLPELMKRYNPHAVFYRGFSPFNSLQQLCDHFRSRAFDKRGLSAGVGLRNYFWPAPISWSPQIWGLLKKLNLPHWLSTRGLEVTSCKLLTALKVGKYHVPGASSPYIWVELSYINGLKEVAEEYGARFLLGEYWREQVIEERFYSHLKLFGWYKPEWVASKILPWPHLRSWHIEEFTDKSRQQFQVLPVDLTEYVPENHTFSADFHPNPEGVEIIGRAFGAALAKGLAAEFPAD